MTRNMVVYYNKDNYNPCGSDYTLFMELKTTWGIQRRIQEHNRIMLKRGMKYYIIIPYYTWKANTDYEKYNPTRYYL